MEIEAMGEAFLRRQRRRQVTADRHPELEEALEEECMREYRALPEAVKDWLDKNCD